MSSSFDGVRYLELAEELAGRREEACKRSAVSRAYYCVFHHARKLVEREGFAIPRMGRAHDEVWDVLDAFGKQRTVIAHAGVTLRILRRAADYERVFGGLDLSTARAISLARRTMKLLEAELRSP